MPYTISDLEYKGILAKCQANTMPLTNLLSGIPCHIMNLT